eukprot:35829_1
MKIIFTLTLIIIFNMLITDAVGTGACCNSDGSCQGSVSGGDCSTNDGYWQAEMESCVAGEENVCSTGACCTSIWETSELQCFDFIEEACAENNQHWYESTSCTASSPKTCPAETAACCGYDDGLFCFDVPKELCPTEEDVFWQVEGASCIAGGTGEPKTCPAADESGACCGWNYSLERWKKFCIVVPKEWC